MRSDDHGPLRALRRLLRLHGRRLALLLLGIGAPLYAFGHLAEDVWEKEPFPWDRSILELVHSGASPAVDACMLWLSGTGHLLATVGVPLVAVGVFLSRGADRPAFFLGGATLGAAGLVVALKVALHRPRPSLWASLAPEESFSFPSGHAMTSLVVALALVIVTWRTPWRWVALLAGVPVALLIGCSRVYLGVHYPSDVLAGWTAALAWTLGLWMIVRRGEPDEGDPATRDGVRLPEGA